jgi:predicted dienelactone hydrolase
MVTLVGLAMLSCQATDPSKIIARRATSSLPPASEATTSPAPAATTPTTTASKPGPVALNSVVLNLVDHSRPTVSHGRLIATSRALTTTVWYPAGAAGPYPLVVFAHGYSVGLAPYLRVCKAWASAGFVVGAPTFPLTDKAIAGSALDEHDMVNQPADVSFVLSSLLASNATSGGPLSGMIDPQRIAVAGHSDGADTALAVAYLPGNRDLRVRAAIVDAPDPLPLPAPAAKLVSTIPLLLVHGDRDPIAPFPGSRRVLAQLSAPGWFLILQGADHLSPIEGPSQWTPVFDRATTDFLLNVFDDPAALGGVLATDLTGNPATLQGTT